MRVTPNCDPLGEVFYIYYDGPTPAQYEPEIAFGGGYYLVVWADGRIGNRPVYASRVTPAGSVLDPAGLLVSRSSTQVQYYPSVTWGGTRYLVIWGNYSPSPYYVYGRFVNTNGTMASDTLRLASGSEPIYHVDAAYDGTNFLVIWTEYGSVSALKGVIVSGSGVPIGSPFTIASPVYYFKSAQVCFDGTNYFVAYSVLSGSVYQLWGRKYNTSGSPVGSAFRITPSTYNIYYNDVVPGANNCYLNVWNEAVTPRSFDIYGNIDIPIIGIEETTKDALPRITLPSIIKEQILIPEFAGKMLYLYDVSGRSIASTKTGYFDCSRLENGVYFIRVPEGAVHKVIKID